jgi:hypothetical protein
MKKCIKKTNDNLKKVLSFDELFKIRGGDSTQVNPFDGHKPPPPK